MDPVTNMCIWFKCGTLLDPSLLLLLIVFFWGHYDIFSVCLFFSLVDIITKHVFLLPFSFSFLIALVFIDFSCDSDGHDADCEEEDATCLFIWLLHVG